jgi:SagB-type dehydrogenase family enzyme
MDRPTRRKETAMLDTEAPDLAEQAPVALLYHENSKLTEVTSPRLAASVAAFAADEEALRRAASGIKTYPSGDHIPLPPARRLPRPRLRLDAALRRRRSLRESAPHPLAFASLAALLEHAAGMTASASTGSETGLAQPLRAWPSGGALYPVEVYVAAFDVAGVAPGIYHHHPGDRSLEVVRAGAARAVLAPHVLTASGGLDAPALLVLAGRWGRTLSKYGERGYRIVLLDAGHLAQNLLLVAAALGLAVCPIAGFHDDALAAALDLDPAEEPVLHAITVGHAPAAGV